MKIVCISCYQQYNIKSSSKFKFKIFFLSHDQIMDTKLCVNAIDLDSFIKVKPISPWFHFDIHKWVKHSRLTIILVEKCTPPPLSLWILIQTGEIIRFWILSRSGGEKSLWIASKNHSLHRDHGKPFTARG